MLPASADKVLLIDIESWAKLILKCIVEAVAQLSFSLFLITTLIPYRIRTTYDNNVIW